ncbi:MAG: sodium:proton antiporter [Phycisphaeraceae bacterium]|nr:sodium:proton antiporter [Phycisphaerales bacterium]MCB9841697.1 sodium:proton antiporter [Phycisphaeraceae bacterium]
MTDPLLAIVLIIALGVASQWLARRLQVPSILILLGSGFLVGPVAHAVLPDGPFLAPNDLFGDLLLPIVSLSVGLILYEGGLTLRFSEIKKTGGSVYALVTVGMVITWLIAAGAAHVIVGLETKIALLLGAIVVVSGPTVVGPMLRQLRPTGPTGAILKWEGILIDPIGVLLAVLVFEVLLVHEGGGLVSAAILLAVKTTLVGVALGLAGGIVLTELLRRFLIPDDLHNPVSIMLVLAAYGISDAIAHESGLFAATVMGIYLANQKRAEVEHIVEFKENIRALLLGVLFIVLAARLELSSFKEIGWTALAFVAVLILLARPLSVFISTGFSKKLSLNDKLLLSWFMPRGIVAAALSSVFALRLAEQEHPHPQAAQLLPLVFAVIVVSILVYGLTVPVVARRLGLANPNPQGVVFIGARPWTRQLASLLQERGFRVRLLDTNRSNVADARLAGLPATTANVLDEDLIEHLDLGGMGRLLALTPNELANRAAARRFAPIFGRANVFVLSPESRKGVSSESANAIGRTLFAPGISAAEIERRTGFEAKFKATRLSDEFTWQSFRDRYGTDAVPVMIITADNSLRIIAADEKPDPKPGQTIIALVHDESAATEQSRKGPTTIR